MLPLGFPFIMIVCMGHILNLGMAANVYAVVL